MVESLPPAAGSIDWQHFLHAAFDNLMLGGPVAVLLAFMSVLALAIILAKYWQLQRAGIGGTRRLRQALQRFREGNIERAIGSLADRDAGTGPVAMAMGGLRDGTDEVRLREEVLRTADATSQCLRSWLRPLEVMAALAPLVGLFGTVLGMIKAFAALEAAGSRVDPSILSGGIWVALLTTAAGLAVAIPCVIVVNWFDRRIERFEYQLDHVIAGIFATPVKSVPNATHQN